MINQLHLTKSILVVEDDKDIRESLVEGLQFHFKKVSSAVDGCDALEKIQVSTPDIIISDIEMPCLNGFELLKRIKSGFISNYKPVIILTTAFSDKEYLLEALDIKVDAYLIKPINVNTLINKIKESVNCCSSKDLKYKKLSTREYEVFLDLSKGLKPSEIAFKYDIKAKTISTYRNRIFDKMSFKSNAELIKYSIKNNLN